MKNIRKIDTARRVYELDGSCIKDIDFECKDCFYYKKGAICLGVDQKIKASALAYILSKSRKPEEVARLRKDNPLKDEVQAIQKKMTTTDTFKEPIQDIEDEADELPECIKITDPVPEFCYHITQKAIKWNRCKFVTEKTSEGETSYILLEHGGIRSFGDETYRSLDDAVAVLKSREVK